MKFDTVICGGQVATPDGMKRVDVAIRDQKIAAIGPRLDKKANGADLIDATGRLVLPGILDVHVHLDMPFCGTASADDYNTGTRAAARGGVTTVIDFAIPAGKDSLNDSIDHWQSKAEGKACIDYGLHTCITDVGRHIKEIPALMKRGVTTFKEYMIYAKQGWQADDKAIFKTLETCKETGALLMVHAESSDVLDELIERAHKPALMKKYGAVLHSLTRPPFIEAEAVQRAILWAEATGGKLYIVHISTGLAAQILQEARERGVDVWGETCPQYLVLDDSAFARKDGHLYATCPQLKSPADQQRLWKALKKNAISVLSTDTCTFDTKQKAMWKGDFTKIPMGMPGLETLLPVAYTFGVLGGRLSLTQLVHAMATHPAKLMGLYPKKGVIRKGSDADLAIIHPDKKIKVDWRKMETHCDWSPFQGWSLAGFAEKTFSRGRLIVDNYKFVGENGWGQYLPRRTAIRV